MKNLKRLVAFLLINCLIFSNIGTVGANAVESQKVFEGDGYRIVVTAIEQWTDGYLGSVVVTNMGTQAIKNWKIISSKNIGKLDNVWNIDMSEEEDTYVWGCQVHNRTVPVGGSVSFGYQASNGSISALDGMKLQRSKRQPRNKGYEISYQIKSSWANHAIIETTIHNTSEEALKDWELELTLDADIDSIWNASIKGHTNEKYIIENEGYNADIAPSSSIAFEMQVDYSDKEVTCPANCVLSCELKDGYKEDTTEGETEGTTEDKEELTTEEVQDELDEIEYTDWNWKMIHADSKETDEIRASNPAMVKVCILDSGIDYIPGLNVVEYKDFLDGYDEDIMYNDINGHGTAVAGILAANAKEIVTLEEEEEEDFSEDEVIEEEGDFDESQFQNVSEKTVTPQTDPELKTIMEQDGDAIEEEDIEEEEEEDECLDWDEPEDIEEWLGEGQKCFNGVNPNVEIYSGRILDEENETTVERAVAGIEWAIENQVNVLSISWGLDTSSEQLHRAIKKAYKAGILIIAAAGNEEAVQYPACYKEVMAVGSVNSEGIAGENSPKGKEIEVVAPGEDICSYSSFGMLDMYSGTSFAVPQVVGLAALIWQKDVSRSSEFVRQLIDISANSLDGTDNCGYGLIDYENALQQYDSFSEVYVEQESLVENVDDNIEEGIIEENDAEVPTIDTAVIKGLWSGTEHENMTKGAKKFLKIGAKVSDSSKKFKGMKNNPGFHGYFGEGISSTNYIKAYLYLTEQAASYLENGKYTNDYQTKGKGIEDMHKTFSANIESVLSKTYSINGEKGIKITSKKQKFYFVYGMALHTLADIFAHSAYAYSSYEIVKAEVTNEDDKNDSEEKYIFKNTIAWTYISHGFNMGKDGFAFNRADNKAVYNARYTSAQKICKKVINRIKKGMKEKKSGEQLVGKVSDFNAISKQNIKRLSDLAEKSKKNKVHDGDELYKLCRKVFLLKGFYANIHSLTKDNKDKYKKLLAKAKNMDLKKVKKKLSHKVLVNVVLKNSNKITFKQKKARIIVHYKEGNNTKTVKLKKGKFSFSLDARDKNKKKIKYWITIKAPAQNTSSASKSKAMRQYSLQSNDTQEREYTTTKLLNIADAPDEKMESKNWTVFCNGGEIEFTDEDFIEEKQARAMLTGLITKDETSQGTNLGSGKVDVQPLSGVTVSLKQGTKVVDACTSDSKGVYQFAKVPKGSYVLHYECAGYIPVDYYISIKEEDTVVTSKQIAMIKEMSCDTACYEGGVVSQRNVAGLKDVDGLSIEARRGIYNKTGTVVGTTKTQSDGSFELKDLSMGYYTLHIFREGESKYKIYDEYVIAAVNKEQVRYMDSDLIYVQSLLTAEKLRIKLYWGDYITCKSILSYRDSNQQLHKLFYGNDERSKEIMVNYGLHNSMFGYIPPETVDIYNAGEYGYDYYVYGDGMMPEQLQFANATVQLYEQEKNDVSYTFHPPVGSGKYWKVFHYDGETGQVTPINQMVDEIE